MPDSLPPEAKTVREKVKAFRDAGEKLLDAVGVICVAGLAYFDKIDGMTAAVLIAVIVGANVGQIIGRGPGSNGLLLAMGQAIYEAIRHSRGIAIVLFMLGCAAQTVPALVSTLALVTEYVQEKYGKELATLPATCEWEPHEDKGTVLVLCEVKVK